MLSRGLESGNGDGSLSNIKLEKTLSNLTPSNNREELRRLKSRNSKKSKVKLKKPTIIEIEPENSSSNQNSSSTETESDIKVQARVKYLPLTKSGSIESYYKCAPAPKLKHPLEENIFTSLLLTLFAVSGAIICGIPILVLVGGILVISMTIRYFLVVVEGCWTYLVYICANRNIPANRNPPTIFPYHSLVVANDIRWLSEKGPIQPISHTILIFEGSLSLSNLRNLFLSRIINSELSNGQLNYPRLRSKIVPLLGAYTWQLDPSFNIANHINLGPSHMNTIPKIQKYLSALVITKMDVETKAPWEIFLFPSIPPNDPANNNSINSIVLLRVHQCLSDGVTLLKILCGSLSDRQQVQIPIRPHFGGLSFGFNILRAVLVGPLTVLLWYFLSGKDKNFITKPVKKFSKKKRKRRKKLEEGVINGDKIENELNLEDSEWRVGWRSGVSVAKVGRVKQIMRATFNDVLLSALGGSLRKYIQCQGIHYPSDIKVVIPVDLRSSHGPSRTLGSKIAVILASLSSSLEGSIPRLWSTRHKLDEVKASADPVVYYAFLKIITSILPLPLVSPLLNFITNKASVQFTNIAGPSNLLLIGGYPLKSIYPFWPPSGGLKVGVSAISYGDQIYFTVLSHASLPHFPSTLLQGISLQIDQLSRQLSSRRVPGESRRSLRSAPSSEITKPPTKQIHIKLQVVQEELHELSTKLESSESKNTYSKLYHGSKDKDKYLDPSTSYYPTQQQLNEITPQITSSSSSTSTNDKEELRSRMKTLKTEFSELFGELQRRSSIVEGVPISFEDEETEDEFRRPRKRALSVVSVSRRGSLFAQSKHLVNSSDSFHSFPNTSSAEVSQGDGDEDYESSESTKVSTSLLPQHHHSSSPSTSVRIPPSPIRTTAV